MKNQEVETPAWWDDEEERRIRFEVQYRYGLMKVGPPPPSPTHPARPLVSPSQSRSCTHC